MSSTQDPYANETELATCVTTLISEFKVMREEFQALKAAHALPPSGAASSSSTAAASPTKGSDGVPAATRSGLGKEVPSKKRRREAPPPTKKTIATGMTRTMTWMDWSSYRRLRPPL